MGYRPTINCKELGSSCYLELGKFYGYVKLENLKSIKWLIDNKFFNEEEIEDPYMAFIGGYGPSYNFTAEEFREFIKLYEKDINEYDYSEVNDYPVYEKPYSIADHWDYFYKNGIVNHTFYQMYDSPYDKNIEWS